MSAGEQILMALLTLFGAGFAYAIAYGLTCCYDESPRENHKGQRYALISAMILLYGVALIFGFLALLSLAKNLIEALL